MKNTRKPGAPITYGPKAKAAVIYLKAEGRSDRTIGQMGELKLPDGEAVQLPSRDTIEEWRNPKGPQYDEVFSRQYARACEDSLWSEHEKLAEINRKLEAGEIDPAAARVMSDNIKWDLARRMRHIFGDRSEVDVNARHSGNVNFYLPDNQRKG